MASHFEVSGEAQNDLFEIWRRVAEDSVDLANRLAGRMPRHGHTRKDLTKRPVPFASWRCCEANAT
jgi:hypothetical protein